VQLHPRAVKNCLGVIYRENLQVHPQAEQESIFRTFLLGGLDLEVYLVVLDGLLRATTKKVVNFLRKSAPPDKIPATPVLRISTLYSKISKLHSVSVSCCLITSKRDLLPRCKFCLTRCCLCPKPASLETASVSR